MKKDFLIRFLSSGFGVSFFIPWVPGIWGVFLGWLASLAINNWPIFFKLIFFAVFCIFAYYLSNEAEKIIPQGKDSPYIAVDEINGMVFVSLWFNIYQQINIFNHFLPLYFFLPIVFCFFDSVKFFPANISEKLPGGLGVVIDDLIDGVYAIIIIFLALKFIF